MLLRGQELRAELVDGQAGLLFLPPRQPAGVQVGLLRFVLRERLLGLLPRAEVMELAADLLRPAAVGVREQREVRAGLLRPDSLDKGLELARMACRHGDTSLTGSLCWAGLFTAGRPLLSVYRVSNGCREQKQGIRANVQNA